MKSAPLFSVLVLFGVLGCVFLGLAAGLANVASKEYVDYTLLGEPVVREYEFRIGGKYELVTVFLLVGGSVLAIGGNFAGISVLYRAQSVQSTVDTGISRNDFVGKAYVMCLQCKNKLPAYSKFCPKCGADVALKTN